MGRNFYVCESFEFRSILEDILIIWRKKERNVREKYENWEDKRGKTLNFFFPKFLERETSEKKIENWENKLKKIR